MLTKINKWGNSNGIRLSKRLLSRIGIEDPVDQKINVEVEDNKLVITKADNCSKLMQRFKGFDLDNYYEHQQGDLEYGWGKDVGLEKF